MNRDTIILNPLFRLVARFMRVAMRFIDPYGRVSYAQEGEDLLLQRIFAGVKQGFYVDVGAHHPLRFSNTYLLYRRGWRGVNIDAMPGSMDSFGRLRPSDINVESAVALEDARLTYFVFKEKALNTFDENLAEQYTKSGLAIVSRLEVRARPLADLLSEHLPAGQSIDLLTVDVEGLDLDVLKSNDWQRFRPRVLIVEELRQSPRGGDASVRDYLIGLGYGEFARTYNSVFYVANGEHF
ncbi:MAG: FkbM family methyltransferase [Gallionella sp.]|nr:FkbM family methyltransferase [Gallionella sp.]